MSPYKKITSQVTEAYQEDRLLNAEETMEVLLSLKRISQNKLLLEKIVAYIQSLKNQETTYKFLSKRELQVFKLIGCNFSSSEISIKLSISKNTVATHRKNIIKKLHLKGTRQLKGAANIYIEKELRKN